MTKIIILDTETTGLDSDAEIVEISVINELGEVLLDTLIKPTKPIPASATAIHGITDDMVATAPTYDLVHPKLVELLEQYSCYIYNSQYDIRLIEQTCSLYGITFLRGKYWFYCLMERYADKVNYGRWAKLTQAYDTAIIFGASPEIHYQAHRSLGDCHMTLAVKYFLDSIKKQQTKPKNRRYK